MRMVTETFPVWKYQEAPDEVKERILERYAFSLVEDTYWYEWDNLVSLNAEEVRELGIDRPDEPLVIYKKKYFDIEGNKYLQLENPSVPDEELFRKWLKIPKELWDKVEYVFEVYGGSRGTGTTYLEFMLNSFSYSYSFERDLHDLTRKDFEILERACDIWKDKIWECIYDLQREYEYRLSEEALADHFEINEYEFNEQGEIHLT